MEKIIEGKRYSVEESLLIASDRYDKDVLLENEDIAVYIYKTNNDNYFATKVNHKKNGCTSFQPISFSTAVKAYEILPQNYVSYKEAFDLDFEEA
jgi:hypothetical protein